MIPVDPNKIELLILNRNLNSRIQRHRGMDQGHIRIIR